jgi:hypothetical protein
VRIELVQYYNKPLKNSIRNRTAKMISKNIKNKAPSFEKGLTGAQVPLEQSLSTFKSI